MRSIADGYVLDKWEITSNGTAVDESKITRNEDGSAELNLEAGGDYVFNAVLREKKFAKVTAEVNDSTMGSATVTVGESTGTSQYPVYEGQSVTLTATPGSRYMLELWEVKDADNKDVTYTVAEDVNNVATFIMPDTGKSITAKAFFKVDPEQASTENALTAVELDVPGAAVSRSGSTFTITLPAGTNTSKLSEKILKLTISDLATVTKEGDPDKDWTAGAACGMELDKAATFTVIARNPPDNIPDRTAAFAEVFDILYGMYPEANMGTSTVVLCLNDLNENDYDCAVNGIGAYCRANGIKLSYSSYGESPDNAALLDEENLIFTFERVRYPRSISGNIKVTFRVQKYHPGATGFALNVSCDWKSDAWDCYWTGSQEITASNP